MKMKDREVEGEGGGQIENDGGTKSRNEVALDNNKLNE